MLGDTGHQRSQIAVGPLVEIESAVDGFADAASQKTERRAPAPYSPARQLLRRDVEPMLSGEIFACLTAANEAPRPHDLRSADMSEPGSYDDRVRRLGAE